MQTTAKPLSVQWDFRLGTLLNQWDVSFHRIDLRPGMVQRWSKYKQPLPSLQLSFISSNGQHKGKALTLTVLEVFTSATHTGIVSTRTAHFPANPRKKTKELSFHLHAAALEKNITEERTGQGRKHGQIVEEEKKKKQSTEPIN